MTKRSMLFTALALILVAGISIGGTMAYFQAKVSIPNTFSIGDVDISLDETEFDAVQQAKAQNLAASATVKKNPTVHNEGHNPCYVRVRVDGLVYDPVEKTLSAGNGLYAIGLNAQADWFYNGEYFYYKEILDAKGGINDSTSALFTDIGLSEKASEGPLSNIGITVYAEAIQCEGTLAPANPAAPTENEITGAFGHYTDA